MPRTQTPPWSGSAVKRRSDSRLGSLNGTPRTSSGPIPPVPAVDTVECWLPPDKQCIDEALCADLAQVSLAQLKEALQQHHADLGNHIDSRLETMSNKVEELFRGLAQETTQQAEDFFVRLSTPPKFCSGDGAQHQDSGESRQNTAITSTEGSGIPRAIRNSPTFGQAVSDPQPLSFEYTEMVKKTRTGQFEGVNRATIASSESVVRQGRECRAAVRKCLEAHWCETLVCVLILSNVCYLGFEVQSLRGVPEGQFPLGFRITEYVYSVSFSVELGLRLLAYGCRHFFLGPNQLWNIIDLLLVVTSLLGTIMDILLAASPNLQYLRIIRMARTVRILRVVHIVKIFRPLRILICSVVNTVRNLGWMLVLMLIIIYLFAVTFTLAASNHDDSAEDPELAKAREKNFGSLWGSILCLFKASTGGIDWSDASEPLEAMDPFWAFLFLGYIAFCNLAVMNVVTGVVVQTAIESARQDQDLVVQSQLAVKQRYVKQLEDLFEKVHSDRSGKITLKEFEERLQDSNLEHYFEVLELTIDEAWNLFKLLDNRNTGTIDIDDFVSGCLKLKGNARSIDMHMLMYQSKWTMDRIASVLTSLEIMSTRIDLLYGTSRQLEPFGQSSQRLARFTSRCAANQPDGHAGIKASFSTN